MTDVVTRIAPSPTGMMHIGTARTALFNYLYAKHTGGKFLLRVEDTDRERSTDEAVKVILDGLDWLGLPFDDEPVFQAARAERHREVVDALLASGKAYACFMTPADAKAQKEANPNKAFRSMWRDLPGPAPGMTRTISSNVPFVIRFKGPTEGETVVHDLVRGTVRFNNETFDDLVLLRSDGTPTYNLAVVVDDHDMGITHVIRGDDHLNNAGRQKLIYEAMGWDVPAFAHIPLIFNPEGKKLSKRDGAASIMDFAAAGYLPETMRNYLTRLGWGHGSDEIFSDEQAIDWFDVADVVSAPARMDPKKLDNMNHHYMREADNGRLCALVAPMMEAKGHTPSLKLVEHVALLKDNARTLVELADLCLLVNARVVGDEKADAVLADPATLTIIMDLTDALLKVTGEWTPDYLNATIRAWSEMNSIPMKKIGPGMRAALTGRTSAPDLGTLLVVIGKDASFERIVAEVHRKIPSIAGVDR